MRRRERANDASLVLRAPEPRDPITLLYPLMCKFWIGHVHVTLRALALAARCVVAK